MPETPAKKKKPSNTPKRAYPFSDGLLHRKVSSFLVSIRRDKDLLAEFNVTDTRIDALEAMLTAFDTSPADQLYQGGNIANKGRRNNKHNEIYKAILALKLKIEDKWENEPEIVAEFGLKGNISRLTAEEIYEMAKAAADVLDNYATDLGAAYHVDAAYVAAFHAKVEALKNALTAFKKGNSLRNGKTIERITLGNKLYKEMIKLANIGKAYWAAENNPAYFDEYVIGERREKKKEDV